ncbi:MAG: ASCH domain-containing protein [Blastocatellia bacterium]|nr:ASCH domain-containing protein [Blastocatellia bacterium]
MRTSASKTQTRVARWTPTLAKTRALSLRQPWAWLVVNGYKDIENRSWRTNHRGPLLIHASSTRTDFTIENLAKIEKIHGVRVPQKVDIGGIVGLVDVADCLQRHSSKWYFSGNWAWVLKRPQRLPFRECKAVVGLFTPKFKKR